MNNSQRWIKMGLKAAKHIGVVLAVFWSFPLCAALHPKSEIMSVQGEISPELIAAYETQKPLKEFDYNSLLPENIATLNQSQILPAMVDRGFNNWFNSPEVQKSSLGQTAKQVEKTMKQEVSWSGENQRPQKVAFQVMAFQATAKLQYEGYVHALAYHQMNEGISGVELSEKVGRNEQLVLSQTRNSLESKSQILLRMSF